jgi:uncharacterized protein (TIGR02265 family)
MPEPPYRAPDFATDLDVDAAIAALPARAHVKGLFFSTVVDQAAAAAERARVFELAGLAERRYTTFFDYPYADFVRVVEACARLVHPSRPTRDGIRRLGARFHPVFADTLAGRVVFGALGLDAAAVLPLGPKGWKMTHDFAHVSAEKLARNHVRYHFRDTPALLDSIGLGVVEGALDFFRVSGEVRIAQRDPGNASYDIRFEP